MKVVKILLGLVVVAAIGFFGFGATLPVESSISRSIVIEAPAAVVFDNVSTMEKQQVWNPWRSADDTMKVNLGQIKSGVGASYSWTSENSGDGTLTVAAETPHSSITENLDFGEMGVAEANWTFEEADGKTTTTWGFVSQARSIPERYFGMMLDDMVGPQFESGLAGLKTAAEAEVAQIAAEAEAAAATAPTEGTAPTTIE